MSEDGRWQMEDGRWKMADGRWKGGVKSSSSRALSGIQATVPKERHPGLDPGSRGNKTWIPAFAGMTDIGNVHIFNRFKDLSRRHPASPERVLVWYLKFGI